MSGRLAGKVALISGTAGGQGRRAAIHFAAEGAKIVGCDVKDAEAKETVEMVRADLTEEDAVKRWIDFAVDAYGDFDILYNNAAVAKAAILEDVQREDWDWNFANELTLVFLAVKHALPVFERRGSGVIINVGSIAGMVGSGMPGNAAGNLVHCVAKAAVIRLTENLAIELSTRNIRVNSISPGVIDTPQLRPFLGEEPDAPIRTLFASKCLVPRIGEVEDIVNAAVFLASDESAYITGVNLPVDGGFSCSGGVGRPTSEVDDAVAAAMTRY